MREMKDSGYGYLGSIPLEWKIERIKNHLKFCPEKNPGDAIILSLYRELGIVPKDSRDDNHNVTSEDTSNYRYVRVGDFVINKMKAWQGSMAVSDYEGVVSPAYYVYNFTSDELDRKYFHFLLRSRCYAEEFRRLSAGIRIGQWDLPRNGFETTCIAVPSLGEQQLIAQEIDQKTKAIDELIFNVQSQIDKLDVYKRSIITETVLKRFDSSTPKKDSEVEWIGSIPSHWKQAVIGRLCFVTKLAGFEYTSEMNGNITESGDVPIVRAQNIKMGRFIEPRDSFISFDISNKLNRCALDKKCVLITFIGAGIGEVAVFERDVRYHLAPNVAKIVINDDMKRFLTEEYLLYFLMSNAGQEEVNKIKKETAQPSLSMQTIRSIAIVIPTLEEQAQIVSMLDRKCSQIDQLIAIKQKKIEKLEQYKKSLIYEYVTGKKEVS